MTTTIRALAALLLMANTTPSGQPLQKQPSDYTPAAQSQVVSWQVKRVPPPSSLYVSVDDQLVVVTATSQTSEVVTVNYRLLRAADAKIVAGQFTVAPASTRAIKVQTQQLAEGFLLSASVRAAVATTRGQTFVRVFLGAGPFGASEPSYMLMADYATTAMAPAHPNGRVLAPTEGPGWIYSFDHAAPGVGNEHTLAVPANARWRLISCHTGYNASAVVANRNPRLRLIPGPGASWSWLAPLPAVIAASNFMECSWGMDAASGSSPTNFTSMSSIPQGAIILATGLITTLTENFQTGDFYSAMGLHVEEWLDNV